MINSPAKKALKSLKGRHPKLVKNILKSKMEPLIMSGPCTLAAMIKSKNLDFTGRSVRVLIYDAKHAEIIDNALWYQLVPAILGQSFSIQVDYVGFATIENKHTVCNKIANTTFGSSSSYNIKNPSELKGSYDIAVSFCFSQTRIDHPLESKVLDFVRENSTHHFQAHYHPKTLMNSALFMNYHGFNPTKNIVYNPYHLPRAKDTGLAWSEFFIELETNDSASSPLLDGIEPQTAINQFSTLTKNILSGSIKEKYGLCQRLPNGKVHLGCDIFFEPESNQLELVENDDQPVPLGLLEHFDLDQPPEQTDLLSSFIYSGQALMAIASKQTPEASAA